ncbi:MAG: protein-glutamate O-methyltransferase CheR [Epsilonproteobacteria bacterium]|nr:protein-glutamate O-methyltransferase CheR [Campylobacterota bacterium]
MITEADYKKLRDVLYRRTGIDLDMKRFKILKPKLEKLMREMGYDNFRSFFHDYRFKKNKEVEQALLNTVTINETYFYREKHQFESLVNDVLYQIDKIRPKDEVIRILCAPSSTGEEPYSIALHLLDEGKLIEKRDFEIVGIDIDSNVIKKAQKGIFTKRSIQYVPPHILKEYFTQRGMSYEIADFLKEAVEFKVVNVMDKFAMKKLGKFDVIFSRNMLIYFNDESRRKVAMTFYEMLKPKGVVFLGHAESMSRIVSVFKTAKSGSSIYYIKD